MKLKDWIEEMEHEQLMREKANKELRQSAREKQEGGEHYKKLTVQPWDVVDTWNFDERFGFYRGNALKYIMRCGLKDARVQELKKAKHYLEKIIEMLETAHNGIQK